MPGRRQFRVPAQITLSTWFISRPRVTADGIFKSIWKTTVVLLVNYYPNVFLNWGYPQKSRPIKKLMKRWTNPGRGEMFRMALGATQPSYTMGTGSFSGVKRPGRCLDHPHPSSADVKERVELHLCSTPGTSWRVIGWTLSLPLPLLFLFRSRVWGL